MKPGIFLFYFVILLLFFVSSRNKQKPINLKRLIILPAFFALILAMLSVIKIYIIYKIFLIIIGVALMLLTYWQWKDKINKWL